MTCNVSSGTLNLTYLQTHSQSVCLSLSCIWMERDAILQENSHGSKVHCFRWAQVRFPGKGKFGVLCGPLSQNLQVVAKKWRCWTTGARKQTCWNGLQCNCARWFGLLSARILLPNGSEKCRWIPPFVGWCDRDFAGRDWREESRHQSKSVNSGNCWVIVSCVCRCTLVSFNSVSLR